LKSIKLFDFFKALGINLGGRGVIAKPEFGGCLWSMPLPRLTPDCEN